MAATYAYWIATALLSLLYLTSATLYLTKGQWVRQNLAELSYPSYLVPVLTAIKILAVIAILSRISMPLSDLAYAGIFYHLLLALLAHVAVRKPKEAIPAVMGLVLLTVSFATQNVARATPSPYGLIAAIHPLPLN